MPDLKPLLEALLFGADGPLRCERLAEVLDVERGAVLVGLQALAAEYGAQGRGFYLEEVAGAYQLRTRPEYADYLRRLGRTRVFKFSRPALETLAIIAYRQPVTRGDMEETRGVTINALILRQLEDRGWIEVIGHREAPGRPALFATTRQFLDDLGLASLDQLPVLETPAQQAGMLSSLARSGDDDQPSLDIETPADPPAADAAAATDERADDDQAQAVET
jgi:segregation and condensation protein B